MNIDKRVVLDKIDYEPLETLIGQYGFYMWDSDREFFENRVRCILNIGGNSKLNAYEFTRLLEGEIDESDSKSGREGNVMNPQSERAVWNIRDFPRDLRKRVKIKAAQEEISIHKWVENVIRRELDGEEEERP